MAKIKFDSSLDKNKASKKEADYYDTVSLDTEFDFSKKKVQRHTATKRVNIVLPMHLYEEALDIGSHAGTGYQNAIKMALVIGFRELKAITK